MVANTLKDYDAMLMPTLGENFGHIILESLCASCPVIISDQTPWQFSANDHAGIAIALNNKQGFIDAVETLAAASTEMHNQRCLAAYQKGKSFIENEEILAANKALFLES
jgi:glycosyltransferase involved in cell wall biosynthesis